MGKHAHAYVHLRTCACTHTHSPTPMHAQAMFAYACTHTAVHIHGCVHTEGCTRTPGCVHLQPHALLRVSRAVGYGSITYSIHQLSCRPLRIFRLFKRVHALRRLSASIVAALPGVAVALFVLLLVHTLLCTHTRTLIHTVLHTHTCSCMRL